MLCNYFSGFRLANEEETFNIKQENCFKIEKLELYKLIQVCCKIKGSVVHITTLQLSRELTQYSGLTLREETFAGRNFPKLEIIHAKYSELIFANSLESEMSQGINFCRFFCSLSNIVLSQIFCNPSITLLNLPLLSLLAWLKRIDRRDHIEFKKMNINI